MELTKFQIREDVVVEQLDDEVVIVNMATGEYFGAGSVGKDVVGQLKEGRTLGQVVRALMDLYDICEKVARSDAETFIDDLRKQNLVKEVL